MSEIITTAMTNSNFDLKVSGSEGEEETAYLTPENSVKSNVEIEENSLNEMESQSDDKVEMDDKDDEESDEKVEKKVLKVEKKCVEIGNWSNENEEVLKLNNGEEVNSSANLLKKRQELADDIDTFTKKIYPLEFESYSEYYAIHCFKKGYSASGCVDIEMLRRREHGIYYQRIKRRSTRRNNDDDNSDSDSDSNDDMDEDKEEEFVNPDTDNFEEEQVYPSESLGHLKDSMDQSEADAKSPSTEEINSETITKESVDSSEFNTENDTDKMESVNRAPKIEMIRADISLRSIIPTSAQEGSRRRSSRISKKSQERNSKKVKKARYSSDESDGEEEPKIQQLLEALVPKLTMPNRRSDWILEPRQRYTPDKQLQTKAEYEVIKMNELVANERIQQVLSKFEGGVAGVRKKVAA